MPDDPQPIEVGSQGTVKGLDGAGHMLVTWDSGRGLHLIPGVDKFHTVGSLPETRDAELETSFRQLNKIQGAVPKDEEAECPRYGRMFDVHRGAISRRIPYINMAIDPECGTQEAIENFVLHSSEMGLDASIQIPEGTNHTGYDTEPSDEPGKQKTGCEGQGTHRLVDSRKVDWAWRTAGLEHSRSGTREVNLNS